MRCYRDCGGHKEKGLRSFFRINYDPLQVFEMIRPLLWCKGYSGAAMIAGLYRDMFWHTNSRRAEQLALCADGGSYGDSITSPRHAGAITLASLGPGYQPQDAGKIIGAIIGRDGASTEARQALTAKIPGLYINVYDSRVAGLYIKEKGRAAPCDCDTIYITARSMDDVQQAGQAIATIAKHAMEGTLPLFP